MPDSVEARDVKRKPGPAPRPAAERFWPRVDMSGDCWLWTGPPDRDGYGKFTVTGSQRAFAHRFAYEQLVGPIPDGLQLDHLCRVPACVRPEHLEPVTCRENLLRGKTMAAARAAQTECHRGHPFDEKNTYVNKYGHRSCRLCNSEKSRRYYARRGRALRQAALVVLRADPPQPRHLTNSAGGHHNPREQAILGGDPSL